MIELYFFPSPNGLKIAIMLEECGLPYQVVPVDIAGGEQFRPEYLALNPNNKIPTIVDTDTGTSVFESGAILIYLAEKSKQLLPKDSDQRIEVLSWLFWQAGGLGPMAGQAHHFRAFATEEVPYGIERYTNEVNRLYGVMERRLGDADYLAGDYSIADIACWPWIVSHERQGQDLDAFPNVKRWFEYTWSKRRKTCLFGTSMWTLRRTPNISGFPKPTLTDYTNSKQMGFILKSSMI